MRLDPNLKLQDLRDLLHWTVPHRISLEVLDKLKPYFENKKVCDLGCGSGDAMVYIRDILGCKSIRGIERQRIFFKENKEKFELDISREHIENIELNNDDVYFIWLERPQIEIGVIDKLLKRKDEWTAIITYTASRKTCDLHKKCHKGVKHFKQAKKKMIAFRDLLKDKFLEGIESQGLCCRIEEASFNEGGLCRQKGNSYSFIISPFRVS